jgi:PIN domain nuclease of toxin-antitoxin system
MKLLLDSHIFAWWALEPERLSKAALDACSDPRNTLVLSVASVWEMQIKIQLKKFSLKTSLRGVIASQQAANGLQVLPVYAEHALALESLPMHHKDPFDRMLVAQANVEDATLVSSDAAMAAYRLK